MYMYIYIYIYIKKSFFRYQLTEHGLQNYATDYARNNRQELADTENLTRSRQEAAEIGEL